jgi:hypothetical protein
LSQFVALVTPWFTTHGTRAWTVCCHPHLLHVISVITLVLSRDTVRRYVSAEGDTTLADNIEHVSDTADASVTARSIDTVGVGGTFVGLLSAFVDVDTSCSGFPVSAGTGETTESTRHRALGFQR